VPCRPLRVLQSHPPDQGLPKEQQAQPADPNGGDDEIDPRHRYHRLEESAARRKGLVKKARPGIKMSSNRAPKASRERLDRFFLRPGHRRVWLGYVAAILGPALVTAFAASLPPPRGTVIPALLYLMAVVTSAVIGNLWQALLAAALSFVCLDFFFTSPIHTFAISKAEDLFALAVFLAVAATVTGAITVALEQRARAESREHQVRALYNVTAGLLSGGELNEALGDLASSLRGMYSLKGCRVMVLDRDSVERQRAISGSMEGDTTSVPLIADGRPVGRIEMAGVAPGTITGAEQEVLETFAGQLALALERARLGEEAAGARLDAESSRIRAALFASVTHDLRTPLASITASASSLLEEGVPFSDEQRRELLRTILEESERLNRLVANLLDLSRLRAGALVPSVELVPIEDVISAVVERLRPRLAGRSIREQVRGDVPPVPMDVVQIDQVLTNLVENALSFSPPASEIAISAIRWENMVEVKVSDRGPGIPREDRGVVFQEFYRKDVGERRGGTGLGLAIAQAIVAAHGGSMWMENTPGGGATVGFRLPLAPVASAPSELAGPSP
jgi:two-component system, OmpR family, sensor histidine kinase KdpD